MSNPQFCMILHSKVPFKKNFRFRCLNFIKNVNSFMTEVPIKGKSVH